MKRAFFITLNEVRLYLIDKGDLAFGLLLPIITFALMMGAFGGQTIFNATASVVNEDNGTYSQELIKQLDAVDGVSVSLISADKANNLLDRSDLLTAFFIPTGFSDNLTSGKPADIIVKQRGNGGQEGQILVSILNGVTENINQEFQIRAAVKSNQAGRNISDSQINMAVQDQLGQQRQDPSVGVKETTVGGSTNFINQYLPGIVTMYVMFSLTLVAMSIVEERKRGTLERLLSTRLSVSQLFLGKFISIIARGFIQTLILFTLSYAVFGLFTPVSFLISLFIALVFIASAAGIGMIIASISRSQAAANWIAVVVTMFMAMMGGTFFTVAPGSVLAKIGTFSLNTYANDALKTVITKGGSLADAWHPLVVMAVTAVVALIISRLIFKAVPGAGK
jgi:ABC-2 type transport system permease protein